MSAPAFAWALERGAALKLRPTDRLVLIYLADMANGAMVCWPGQPTIVKFTGLAPNTVTTAVRRLAKMQLIRVESSPGIVTRYHILRPATPANGSGTPANGAGVSDANPRKSYGGTPANGGVVTPANGGGPPPHDLREPPHGLRPTPANGGGDPSKTQEDPRARERAREAGKVLRFEKKQEASAPSPQPAPPQPSADVATIGSDDPLDRPVNPSAFKSLIASISRGFQNNYPPRAADLSPEEMIEVCVGKPRVKPLYLPDDVLRQQRAELAARAGAVGGYRP